MATSLQKYMALGLVVDGRHPGDGTQGGAVWVLGTFPDHERPVGPSQQRGEENAWVFVLCHPSEKHGPF